MSIATTSLRYGWKVLAILTIGAGSIFVADNVLNRITTKDRIEVTLAVVERCYGTQYGTNAAGEPLYYVDPPSIVRTWTDTNGASVSMTNSIAWRDDLSMKVELDAKLEALCPYYVDTNSVYDGTTNIVMHTFTGLLTSLDLGDHTNFTAIPAIGTNAATYGPWAWRNYIVAWQERYKVLEALKMTRDQFPYTGRCRVKGRARYVSFGSPGGAYTNWASVISGIRVAWTNNYEELDLSELFYLPSFYALSSYNSYPRRQTYYHGYYFDGYLAQANAIHITNLYSDNVFYYLVAHNVQFWARQRPTNSYLNVDWGAGATKPTLVDHYDSNGFPTPGNDVWQLISESGATTNSRVSWNVNYGGISSITPTACDPVVIGESQRTPYWSGSAWNSNVWSEGRGGPFLTDWAEIYRWQFNYATNAYWE